MPLPLVARVPSTVSTVFTLDEDEPMPVSKLPTVAGYTLIEHLGAGTSSNVFVAKKEGATEEVALKLLSVTHAAVAQCALPRFLREAELTCGTPPHPHLAHGIESGESGTDHYLAMRLLRGQSLEHFLLDRGRLDWRVATKFALQIGKALAHLDAHGIVHRDVKPSNIMVCCKCGINLGYNEEPGRPPMQCTCREQTCVLIDLGLARRACREEEDDDDGNNQNPVSLAPQTTPSPLRRIKTPAYCAIGSPAFMPPECVRDAHTASHAADVYGLGATWYAALTGVLPFSGTSPMQVMKQVLNGEMQMPSTHVENLPKAIDPLMRWLLSYDPKDRPPCGKVLLDELEALLEAPDDVERVARAREALDKRREWERLIARGVRAACAAVGVAVLAWLAYETRKLAPGAAGEEEDGMIEWR